jgi:hypothetical protein
MFIAETMSQGIAPEIRMGDRSHHCAHDNGKIRKMTVFIGTLAEVGNENTGR